MIGSLAIAERTWAGVRSVLEAVIGCFFGRSGVPRRVWSAWALVRKLGKS
jgi:hypothetical protein